MTKIAISTAAAGIGPAPASAAFHEADLGELVLASFRTAFDAQRYEVAEHLLVALEKLTEEDFGEGDTRAGHRLVEAYATVAQ